MQFHSSVETITPEVAKQWLSLNKKNNRNISMETVKKYAREMAEGKWLLTGSGIQFDEDGVLFDGQHRLRAIIFSGVTIRCQVTRGVDRNGFLVVDDGRKRTPADVLSIGGHFQSNQLAAAARHIWLIERKLTYLRGGFSNSRIADVVERHPGVRSVLTSLYQYPYFRRGQVMAVCYWLQRCDKEMGLSFTDTLVTGLELTRKDPVYLLRQRLINDRALRASNSTSVPVTFSIMFRAWEAYLSGESLFVLKPAVIHWPKGGPYVEEGPADEYRAAA